MVTMTDQITETLAELLWHQGGSLVGLGGMSEWKEIHDRYRDEWRIIARAAIDAAEPLIRARVIEELAQEADALRIWVGTGRELAEWIRSTLPDAAQPQPERPEVPRWP